MLFLIKLGLMLSSMSYWLTFATIVVLGNLASLLIFGLPKMRAWLATRRHRKTMSLLKLSPHALKEQLKEKNRVIAFLEDQILQMKADMDRQDMLAAELQVEIKRLTRRNVIMANEVRCDDGHETQLLKPVRSARWG